MNAQQIAGCVPPGTHLKREMEARGWSQSDLAEILGRPIQTINQIIQGKKAITPNTARELEDATAISAETWLNLESRYRLSLEARRDAAVSERASLFSRAPVAEMRRRGWLRDTRDIDKLKQDVLRFLRIESLGDEPRFRFAARKSTTYDAVSPEQEAWCCRAVELAEKIRDVPTFSKAQFEKSLSELRALGKSPQTIGRIPAALRRVGVRFLIVEHLPRTKVDGAAFWIGKNRPVVVLSLRYGRIDHFLFTLFHELIHIRHRDSMSLDNDILNESQGKKTSEIEARANREAAALLVPPDTFAKFIGGDRRIGKGEIVRLADEIGTHPGVVLGHLQHRGVIGWSACRELLVPVRELIVKAAPTDGWKKRS
jgi:HTH-type transcriptional regulator / antitoxin HigA